MDIERAIGGYVLSFEAPDILVFRGGGSIGAEEAKAMTATMVEWSRSLPHLLILADISHIEWIPQETRRVMSTQWFELPPHAIALHGGTFTLQVIFGMLDRASAILSGKTRKMRHFQREAEARDWLGTMRGVLDGKGLG